MEVLYRISSCGPGPLPLHLYLGLETPGHDKEAGAPVRGSPRSKRMSVIESRH